MLVLVELSDVAVAAPAAFLGGFLLGVASGWQLVKRRTNGG